MKSSFGRSFSVFAGILLVALTVLGGSFQMMVQNYLTETSFTRLEQDAAIIQNLAACLDENSRQGIRVRCGDLQYQGEGCHLLRWNCGLRS